MKAFKDLKIGDAVYQLNTKDKQKFLNEKDHYGNIMDYNIISEKIITSLEIIEGHLKINRSYNSYSGRSFDIIIPIKYLKNNRYEDSEGVLIFSDVNDYFLVIREKVVNEIKRYEKEIIIYKEECENNIKGLRKKYWDVLNFNV